MDIDMTWLYQITTASWSIHKQELSSIEDFDFKESDLMFVDTPSKFESFYAKIPNSDEYSRIESTEKNILEIWEWEFYLSLKDTAKPYQIVGERFEIEVISEGTIYIKNSGRRIGFYSFDGIFKINYQDSYTEDYASVFYVFPWMYAKGTQFQEQEDVDKKSDAENELFYINNLQLTGKKQRSSSDSKVLMYSFNFIYNPDTAYGSEWVTRELRKILGLEASGTFLDWVYIQEEKNKKIFKNSYAHLELLQDYEKPIFEEIQGYFSIFFNTSKKIVYYQNLLLADLSELVKNAGESSKTKKVIDTNYEEILSSITENMKKLQSLSQKDYEEFLLFYEDYFYFYSELYPSDFSTKYHITSLHKQFKGIEMDKNINHMYLSYLYTLYNNREISRLELNEWLIKYIVSFSRSLDTTSSKSFYYYYYTYNKILKDHIETLWVQKEWFEDIISILENIAFIRKGYFTTEEVKKWMLYINIEIIESISQYLYELYFEIDRDVDGLLVLKNNDFNIDDSLILNLQKNLDNLFAYMNESAVLNRNNENELSLLQRYERLKKENDEYFEAIINNDAYKNAKVFDTLEQISQYNKQTFEKPNVELATKYLDDFVQVNTSQARVSVIDENYYEIDNLTIWDELVSFELYPLEFNKLTNIKKGAPKFKKLSDILPEEENDFKLQDSDKLTVEELYDYFISLWNIELLMNDISIQSGEYYKVKNINIWGVKYSFKLYPKNNNALKDVMEGLWVTYKLDNLKPEEEWRNNIKETEDYKNFFVTLLIKSQVEEISVVDENEENVNNDSPEANIFKNDFLFWRNGNFTKIANLINLEFQNVDVEEYKNSEGLLRYKAVIEDIKMVAAEDVPKTGRWELVQAKVSSEYFIEAEKRVFKGMRIQFYFLRNSEDDIRLDFEWQKLQVLWDVEIENFQWFYDNLWDDYQQISQIHERKENILWKTGVSNFRYSHTSRDAIISYPYKWWDLRISFQKWKVFKVNYWTEVFEWEEVKNMDKLLKDFL